MNADYNKLKNAYFIDDLSVSYTLFGDDITRGEKPQGTPYISRKDRFDENGFAEKTQSRLSVCKKGGGYLIVLRTHAEDISEFGRKSSLICTITGWFKRISRRCIKVVGDQVGRR